MSLTRVKIVCSLGSPCILSQSTHPKGFSFYFASILFQIKINVLKYFKFEMLTLFLLGCLILKHMEFNFQILNFLSECQIFPILPILTSQEKIIKLTKPSFTYETNKQTKKSSIFGQCILETNSQSFK